MATKPRMIDVAKVLNRTGYGAELKRRQAAEVADRAANAQQLLNADIIAKKDIDAARLLMTTLGGERRPITLEDLKAFTATAKRLGKKFKGGITAAGVIAASLKIDRSRANAQISTAVVTKAQGGRLAFVTNAGPDSDKVRHFVTVEFPAFASTAATPTDAKVLARTMLDGPLRFECDCERFRYFFRYVATVGGFVAGRAENAFPKITNPGLAGMSCKHGLRVMQAIQKDANVRAQAVKMIAAAQGNNTKAQTLSPTEQRAIAARQAAQAHHVKNRIETQNESIFRRAKGDPAKVKALYTAVKIAAERKVKAMVKNKAQASVDVVKDIERTIAAVSKNPVMTAAQRDKLIAQLLAVKTTN